MAGSGLGWVSAGPGNMKQTYSWLRKAGKGEFSAKPNFGFHHIYHNGSVEAWHCTLWEHPQTTRQAKLWGSKNLPGSTHA